MRVRAALNRERQVEGRHVDVALEVSGEGARRCCKKLLLDLDEGLAAEAPNPVADPASLG